MCVFALYYEKPIYSTPESVTLHTHARTSRMQNARAHTHTLTYPPKHTESRFTAYTHNTQNLDLLHALATVSHHYQSRRAGESSDGTNPGPLSVGGVEYISPAN
jgi:hypothetical protein